jgi:hypothetical protein
MKQVAGFPNSEGRRMTVGALLRLQSWRSGVVVTEQIRIGAVNTRKLLIYCAEEPTVVRFVGRSCSVIFGLGVKTRIWWGEAGIPPSVSVGTDKLSRTSAEPSTETWVGVIGNPSFSKDGNSAPSAARLPSTINAVLERSVRILSSI